jgi:hypothetical protein
VIARKRIGQVVPQRPDVLRFALQVLHGLRRRVEGD